MNIAMLSLHDLCARIERLDAVLRDPAASSALVHEACADTPIVGEILAVIAFAHDATPADDKVRALEDARRKLAMILALRELERKAKPVFLPPAPQTSAIADLFRLVSELFPALLDFLGWIGATTQDVVRGAVRRLKGARR